MLATELKPSTPWLYQLSHSFNIINWKLSEIKKLDTKTRKLPTLGKLHHQRADVDRLYPPRNATRWEEKALHGRYPSRIKEADVHMKATNQWLKSSGLKAETKGLITAAQDQTLPLKVYHHHVIKNDTDSQWLICNKHQETVDHVVLG